MSLRIGSLVSSGGLCFVLWPEPVPDTSPAVFWRINGYRAKLLVWTPDEWAKMERRPLMRSIIRVESGASSSRMIHAEVWARIDAEAPNGLLGADCVAVHGGAIERGHGHGCRDFPRQDAAHLLSRASLIEGDPAPQIGDGGAGLESPHPGIARGARAQEPANSWSSRSLALVVSLAVWQAADKGQP